MTLNPSLSELRTKLALEMFVFPDQGTEILRYCDHLIEELQQLFDLEQQKEAHNPHTFAVIIYLKQQILGVEP